MLNWLYHLLNMPLAETKSETVSQLLPSAIDKVGYQKPITNKKVNDVYIRRDASLVSASYK